MELRKHLSHSESQCSHLQNEKKDLQNILNEAVASGDVKKGTDEWYEMVDAITSVDEQIINCNKDIESFQNAINTSFPFFFSCEFLPLKQQQIKKHWCLFNGVSGVCMRWRG